MEATKLGDFIPCPNCGVFILRNKQRCPFCGSIDIYLERVANRVKEKEADEQ